MAVLSAAITCASLALADAGIEMYDLVIGTTAVSGEGLALLGCSGCYNFRVPLLFTNTIPSRGAPEVCVILFNISPHEAPEVCVTLFDIPSHEAPEVCVTLFDIPSHEAPEVCVTLFNISPHEAPEVCVTLFDIPSHEAPEVCVTLFDILPRGAPEAQATIFTVSSHRAFLVLSASFSAVLFKYRTLCGLICDSDFCFVI